MKKILIVLLCLMMILCTGCKDQGGGDEEPHDNKNEITTEVQKQFDALQKQWFIEDMGSDYVDLHFSLDHPENFGIKDVEVTLGELEADMEDTTYLDRLAELDKFNVDELTADQQIMYRTMKAYYDLQQKMLVFMPDYTFVFTPNSGLNNNIITTFAEFTLNNEQEVKDFITLINDTPRYIQQGIDYTLDQASQGIVQPDTVIDSVVDQINRFIANKENNEIIKVFNTRIEALKLANEQQYKDQLRTAVIDGLIPAYQSIISMYDGLYGKCTNSGRMGESEQSKELYQLLVNYKTSTSMSVDELISFMDNAINDSFRKLYDVIDTSITEGYGYTDPQKILEYLQKAIKDDFPAMPELSYTVDFLDPSVTSDNVSAYYLVCPYDNIQKNVVKVNPSFFNTDADEGCLTLAHEGFPGHLLQNTYYLNYHKDNEMRYSMSFIGYSEGWAMYVEQHAYNYFLKKAKEITYQQEWLKFRYYLYAYADLQMHYNNWDISKIAEYYGQFLNEFYAQAYAESIYSSNLGDPGLFLPYAVGMAKMCQLNEKAQTALGKKFDLKEFNQVILDAGETTYEILEEQVDKYIASK